MSSTVTAIFLTAARAFLLAALAGLLAYVPASAAEGEPAHRVKATHGDWVVICSTEDEKDCRATLAVVDQESGTLVVHWAVAFRKDEGKYSVRIRLPLGIWMGEGIAIRIGDAHVEGIAITNCDPLGCYVNALLDEPIISTMMSGTSGELVFRGPDRKEIAAPASMTGFETAAKSLRGR